ncbi:MAG: LytR C-terminal domain-containing protein [Bifidobacteriaceae bacterium]|nr:LytR C-terminal domain-containing protein [Bifidobacteriaceae bacterium]
MKAPRSTPESRRRHLRWRQTAVYTLLIGALALVLAAAVGMWTGYLDAPFHEAFKYKPSASPEALAAPCPVGTGATYPAPAAVAVKVLNGTNRDGLAGATAETLAAYGFPEPTTGNAASYDGLAKLVVGAAGVNDAYTVAEFFPEGVVITLDRRADASVDVILGGDFQSLLVEGELAFDPAAEIEPIPACVAVESILAGMGAAPTS